MSQVALTRLLNGERPTRQETHALMSAIVRGELSDVEISAALVAMKLLGESPDIIAGAASALREAATEFDRPAYAFADVVGTGGDGHGTINISTASAFVIAEAGVPVAKHGNRSVSSKSGAADVMENLGIKLDMTPATARRCLDEVGVTFLFAPQYHAGFRHVAPIRKGLASRTIFNILGPLVNPSRPPVMLVGVYDPNLCVTIAETLKLLGCQQALVVHGLGLDEVALHGQTHTTRVDGDEIRSATVTPADFGVGEFPLSSIQGGDPQHNTEVVRRILGGHGEEAHAAAVAVNSAAVLHLAGKAESLAEAYALARDTLTSGQALERAQRCATTSQENV